MDETSFRKPPDNVQLSAFARRVFDILADHTSFPWAVMLAQCKKVGVDPAKLSPADLNKAKELMANAVGQFTSPAVRDHVLRELTSLT